MICFCSNKYCNELIWWVGRQRYFVFYTQATALSRISACRVADTAAQHAAGRIDSGWSDAVIFHWRLTECDWTNHQQQQQQQRSQLSIRALDRICQSSLPALNQVRLCLTFYVSLNTGNLATLANIAGLHCVQAVLITWWWWWWWWWW